MAGRTHEIAVPANIQPMVDRVLDATPVNLHREARTKRRDAIQASSAEHAE